MTEEYSEKGYRQMLDALFLRFPSFQKVGAAAYKPGIDNMLFFDQLAGHPHRKYMFGSKAQARYMHCIF